MHSQMQRQHCFLRSQVGIMNVQVRPVALGLGRQSYRTAIFDHLSPKSPQPLNALSTLDPLNALKP